MRHARRHAHGGPIGSVGLGFSLQVVSLLDGGLGASQGVHVLVE